jgi:hypothetical protein
MHAHNIIAMQLGPYHAHVLLAIEVPDSMGLHDMMICFLELYFLKYIIIAPALLRLLVASYETMFLRIT